MSTATKELSVDQVAAWHRDGFLVLDDLVDEETLGSLREAYDAIIDRDVEASGDRMLGGLTRQVMIPSAAHPTFDRNPVVKRGIEIARQLFQTDVFRTFDMLIYKPPGHQIDMTKVVVAEIPAGAATMHSYGCPHYTGANLSTDRPRRAYIFNIATKRAFEERGSS